MQPRKPASEDLVKEAWKRVREAREGPTVVTRPTSGPPPAQERTTQAPPTRRKPAVTAPPKPPAPPPPRPSPPSPQPQPRPSRVERRPDTLDLGDPKAVARTLARLVRVGIFVFILLSVLGGFFSVFNRSSQQFTVQETATTVLVLGGRAITNDLVLESDITEGIVVDADGLTLDCAGHSIRGQGEGVGILLLGRTGVTIRNCALVNFDAGIHIVGGGGNAIFDSSVSGAAIGIMLSETSGNTVAQALLTANGTGLALMGGAAGNTVTDSIASGSGSNGFASLDAGPDNVFLRNSAESNRGHGFLDESGVSVDGRYESNRCDANGISSTPDGLCSLSG